MADKMTHTIQRERVVIRVKPYCTSAQEATRQHVCGSELKGQKDMEHLMETSFCLSTSNYNKCP